MKKVIIFIFGVFFCVVITDVIVGACCKFYVKNFRLVGRYEPLDRLIKQLSDLWPDIPIMVISQQ